MHVLQKYRNSISFVEFPKKAIEQSINRRFEEQVRQYPKKIAIKYHENWVSYEELNLAANRLARLLLNSRPEQTLLIAILMDQGITLITAILAVLKAGMIYAPIDRRKPDTQLTEMLMSLQPFAIFADTPNMAKAQRLAQGSCQVINAEAVQPALSGDNLELPITPDAVAYVYYTSGSTGESKGVMDSHRNVLHNVMRYTNSLGFSSKDRMSLVQNSTYSGTVSTIFGGLLNGATVYPFDLDGNGFHTLPTWTQKEGITIFHSVPSIFRQLAANPKSFPELRIIRLEGDKTTRGDIELFKQVFEDQCILINGLGATECGLFRQFGIEKNTNLTCRIVPVGYPVEDMDVEVIDDSGETVPNGVCGEIVVRSPYLALGYWRNPKLTSAKFVKEKSEIRTYRTGDLGTLGPDGCLEIFGRKDLQIRIRGMNVNVAGIEQEMLGIKGITQVLIHSCTDGGDEQLLVAYLVSHPGEKITVSDIRAYLEHRLPSHMIPTYYVFLKQLPITPDGKIDHHGLPTPTGSRPAINTPYVGPGNLLESFLVTLWSEILELNETHIGILDSFFDLGGDSLRAMQMVNRLSQHLEMQINVTLLFENPTIRRLIQSLNSSYLLKTDRLLQASDRAAKQRDAIDRLFRGERSWHEPQSS